jgi:hypothetical protein
MVLYVVQKLPGSGCRSQITSRHVNVAYPEMTEYAAAPKENPTLCVSAVRDRKSVVVIRSQARIRAASAADERRIMQAALDDVTHQKKSFFLVALEELASAIMHMMPPSIRHLLVGTDMLTASTLYNMRLSLPKRSMSLLPSRSFARHVRSDDTPVTPMFAALTDRLDAVMSVGNRHMRHRFSMDGRHIGWGTSDNSDTARALLANEILERHLVDASEVGERTRLSQFEASAHTVLRYATQEAARSEALSRASAALDGQVAALAAEASAQVRSERQESFARRTEINRFFDMAEKDVLNPQGMNWVDIEIEKKVAMHARSDTFFPGVL